MSLRGPSKTVIVEPLRAPAEQPREVPAPPAPTPARGELVTPPAPKPTPREPARA